MADTPGVGSGFDPDIITRIIRIGRKRGLGRREIVAALATGIVESGLRNIDYGDRDSLGIFQQRPSQGWGTRAQIMRPKYAINKFYDAIPQFDAAGIPGWELAARIQRPAAEYRGRYKDRWSQAKDLYKQFGGGPRYISLVQLGKALQAAGFAVGEHSAFDKVDPVHTDGSHHYNDDALDINWRGEGSEKAKLDALHAALRKAGLDELLWQTDGHWGHLHAADTDDQIKVTKKLAALLDIPRFGGPGGQFTVPTVDMPGMPSFPVPGLPESDWVPTFQVPDYPTEPLPIPAEALADFAQRRAAAQRALAEAKVAASQGRRDVNQTFRRFLRDLNRETADRRDTVMDEASARNLAFQPHFVAPRLKDLREERSTALADAQVERRDSLEDLTGMVRKARRDKRDVVEQTRREQARLRSQLDRLIGL